MKMTVKEFNNKEEIEKYYDEKTNTYIFKEDGKFIDLIVFRFDLYVNASISALNIKASNIKACDIDAFDIEANDIDAYDIDILDVKANDIKVWNIEARNIEARNINVNNIKARNISYFAFCFVYNNIKCKSIRSSRNNAKHLVIGSKLEIKCA